MFTAIEGRSHVGGATSRFGELMRRDRVDLHHLQGGAH